MERIGKGNPLDKKKMRMFRYLTNARTNIWYWYFFISAFHLTSQKSFSTTTLHQNLIIIEGSFVHRIDCLKEWSLFTLKNFNPAKILWNIGLHGMHAVVFHWMLCYWKIILINDEFIFRWTKLLQQNPIIFSLKFQRQTDSLIKQ